MLVQASTREEALEVVRGDVYTKSGVWDLDKVGSPSSFRGGWLLEVSVGRKTLSCSMLAVVRDGWRRLHVNAD